MRTWVPGAAGSGFDVDHLPYGVFAPDGEEAGVGVRIGDQVLDLSPVARLVGGSGDAYPLARVFAEPSLDDLLALGPDGWRTARAWATAVLTEETNQEHAARHLHPVDRVRLLLPFTVADYVDFYASEHHASNVGRMFRPDGEPLTPNWKHLPIGYHGRAGTVVVSGTDVVRPCGQFKPADAPAPLFGPSRRLDIEAELAYVVGVGSELGRPAGAFADHVFGVTLLNDWSARDIQGWEYAPLGPFLGKSFATSVSPWVTPLAALEAARSPLPAQDPEPLPYLQVAGASSYDVDVEVVLDGEVVSRPPYSAMYWSPEQMLAHLTVNGASLRTGDLFASGTVSGPEAGQRGCLLELSWGGKEPFVAGGRERTFLEDGDEVVLRASAPGSLGGRITLGECAGRVVAAREA